MIRCLETKVLEALANRKCDARACEVGLSWPVQKLCNGKWRSFLSFIMNKKGDGDQDGINNVIDLCPYTNAGEAVSQHGERTGCAKDQKPLTYIYQ